MKKETKFRPLLAGTIENLKDINFPCIASPKLDGIRCLVQNGISFTRTLKEIPNKYVREKLKELPEGFFDGELIMGDFNTTQSGIMSFEGEPKFEYHIFDVLIDKPYIERITELQSFKFPDFVKIVPTFYLKDINEFQTLENDFVKKGYEGIMVRSLHGLYKYGRSTLKEGILLKYKRFFDSEAIILKVVNLYKNHNESKINELGLKQKSRKLKNLVAMNMVGSFEVYDVKTNVVFDVSTGLTEKQRIDLYKIKDQLIGKKLTYKYQELSKDLVPRFPVFLHLRMGE